MDTKKDLEAARQAENATQIVAQIRQESDALVEDIARRAHAEAARVRENAQQEADKKRNAVIAQAQEQAQKFQDKIFSTLELEKKRIALTARRDYVVDVLDAARQAAADYRLQPAYAVFLLDALIESMCIVSGKEFIVEYSPLDGGICTEEFGRKACQGYTQKTGASAEIVFRRGEYADIGIVVQSADGSKFFDNRFQARLQRMRDELEARIAQEAL